jgi:hypothetical protein
MHREALGHTVNLGGNIVFAALWSRLPRDICRNLSENPSIWNAPREGCDRAMWSMTNLEQ